MRLSMVIFVAACVLVAAAVSPSSASACCEEWNDAKHFAGADVIVEGTALEGPTETGFQRFHVARYLKSDGPEILNVRTWGALQKDSEWRLFLRGSAYDVVSTIGCSGSRTLPAPPLFLEPPPPPEPVPETLVTAPPPAPPAEDPDDPESSTTITPNALKSIVATTAPKTSTARPKAKRPRSAKKAKKVRNRAGRVARLRRR